MMKYLVFVMMVILLSGTATTAQEDDELHCSEGERQAFLTGAIFQLVEAQSLEDPHAVLDAVTSTASNLIMSISYCYGIDFEGDKDTVHDPVWIPAGVYRVTLRTADDRLNLRARILEGQCQDEVADAEFDLFATGRDGAQALLTSEICVLVWHTSDVDAAYSVTFERIR